MRYPPGRETGEQKNKDVTLQELSPYTRLTEDDLVLFRTEAKRIKRKVQERIQAEEAARVGREAVRQAMESGSNVHKKINGLYNPNNPVGLYKTVRELIKGREGNDGNVRKLPFYTHEMTLKEVAFMALQKGTIGSDAMIAIKMIKQAKQKGQDH